VSFLGVQNTRGSVDEKQRPIHLLCIYVQKLIEFEANLSTCKVTGLALPGHNGTKPKKIENSSSSTLIPLTLK